MADTAYLTRITFRKREGWLVGWGEGKKEGDKGRNRSPPTDGEILLQIYLHVLLHSLRVYLCRLGVSGCLHVGVSACV